MTLSSCQYFQRIPGGSARPIDCSDSGDWRWLWAAARAQPLQRRAVIALGRLLAGVVPGVDHLAPRDEDIAHAVGVPRENRDRKRVCAGKPLEVDAGTVEHHEIRAAAGHELARGL